MKFFRQTLSIRMTSAFMLVTGLHVFGSDPHHEMMKSPMVHDHTPMEHKKNDSSHHQANHHDNMEHASSPSHMGESHVMNLSKLGPGKKNKFLGKTKKFEVHAERVPQTPGKGIFTIKILNDLKKPLSDQAQVEFFYEMPGMKMNLPQMTLERLSDVEWKLTVPLTMAGMWKVHLMIEDQNIKDVVQIKFITKNQ